MPDLSHLSAFALLALGMVLMPGPNMVYLVSRSVSQGPRAGLVSLLGVAAGFLVYLLCAALGIADNLVRLSVGVEDLADLRAELDEALAG